MDDNTRATADRPGGAASGERVTAASGDSRAIQAIAQEETLAPQIAPTTIAMPAVIRALRNRDFRLFWGGNFLSNVGTWMENVAQSWLVLSLAPTNSAFWLGVIGFASTAPMLMFSLLGGVMADRVNRRKLMMATQTSLMLIAFILWALTALDRINIPLIVLIAFANGLVMSLNSPAYQSLVPQLVPREDLTNAIALNSAQFNMSRVLGPTLGGFAMAIFGVAGNFLLNAVSFVAVLFALSRITYPPVYPPEDTGIWETLADGFRYLFSRREMLLLIVLVAIASIFGFPYVIFVPLFAKNILHVSETGFGLLMAAQGGGAFLGAATIAYMKNIQCRGRFVVTWAVVFYIGVIAFTFSRNRILSAVLLAIIGYAMVLTVATVNALLQHLSIDKMRGRIMSMYATAFLGFAPIGSILAGSLAETFTAPHAIAAMSLVALLATLALYFTQRELRCV